MGNRFTAVSLLAALAGAGCATVASSDDATRVAAAGKSDAAFAPVYHDAVVETHGELIFGEAQRVSFATARHHEWTLSLEGDARISIESTGVDKVVDTVIWVYGHADRDSDVWSSEPVDGGFNDDDPRYEGELGSWVSTDLAAGEYRVVVELFEGSYGRDSELVATCAGGGCAPVE